jgi:hypothetical protein
MQLGKSLHLPNIFRYKMAPATSRLISPDTRQDEPLAALYNLIQNGPSLFSPAIFRYKKDRPSRHPAFPDTSPLLLFLQFLPGNPTRAIRAPLIHGEYMKALLGFTKFSPGELRDFARATYVGIKDNPVYPNPPVSMEALLAKTEALSESTVAALDGSRKAFAERNKLVRELRRMLVQNGHYVEATAEDKPSFVSSGYGLAPEGRTQTPPLSEAFRNIEYGENSGSFRFRFMAVDGADSYELRWAPEISDGAPGEWKTQPFGKTKSYITITGFTPGVKYMFQVRALIHMAFTDWSDAVTKMCK